MESWFPMNYVSSTTDSTTTLTSHRVPFCPADKCTKNDTIIEPRVMNLPPTEIRSGNYEDCQDLCLMLYLTDCQFFNFYTKEFEGDLKNHCNLFLERKHEGERIPMIGVISGFAQKELHDWHSGPEFWWNYDYEYDGSHYDYFFEYY